MKKNIVFRPCEPLELFRTAHFPFRRTPSAEFGAENHVLVLRHKIDILTARIRFLTTGQIYVELHTLCTTHANALLLSSWRPVHFESNSFQSITKQRIPRVSSELYRATVLCSVPQTTCSRSALFHAEDKRHIKSASNLYIARLRFQIGIRRSDGMRAGRLGRNID